MSQPAGILETLLKEFAKALLPLADELATPESANAFLLRLGFDLPLVPPSLLELAAHLSAVAEAYEDLRAYLDGEATDPLAGAGRAVALGDALYHFSKTLDGLPQRFEAELAAYPEALASLDLTRFARRLLDYLVIGYVRGEYPALYNALMLAGLFEVTWVEHEVADAEADATLPSYQLRAMREDRLPTLFRSPASVAEDVYGWGRDGFNWEAFCERVHYLLLSLSVPSGLYAADERVLRALDPARDGPAPDVRKLRIPLYTGAAPACEVQAGLEVLPVPPTEAGWDAGVAFSPYVVGGGATSFEVADGVTLAVSGDVDLSAGVALSVRPPFAFEIIGGVLSPGGTLPGTKLRAALSSAAKGGARTLLARQPGLFLLDAAGVELSFTASAVPAGMPFFEVALDFPGAALTVEGGQGDGFIQRIIPPGGARTEIGLGLVWSSLHGLTFKGADGLELNLPANVSILGALTVTAIRLALEAEGDALKATAAATAVAQLGPVVASVERVGVEIRLGLAADGVTGNLGAFEVRAGFKPPEGVGLSVDTTTVAGGGQLFWDADKGQYAGALYLELGGKITLHAVGLLATRMPDGSEGYSLLLIISARDFPPVQLGYGFTLIGVGGLLGVNRTGAVDEMRAAFNAGTLGALLSPPDPLGDAARYLGDLQRVFPVAEGRHVFGPKVLIAWGTPKPIMTLDLAMLLELPAPVRLITVGRISVGLPSLALEARPIDLKLDALGVVDFDLREASLDAQLVDSRLAGFPVTGSMALRAAWGDAPGFLLSVGGFHPAFRPPADFPQLKRLSVSLPDVEGYDLRLESYFALTSNTVQFGSRLFVSAEVVGYRLKGEFGFDTLFQLDPFRFDARVDGFAEIRSGSEVVGSAQLSLDVTGPTPWRLSGRLNVESPVSYSCDVDVVVGDSQSKQPLPAAEPADLRSLLLGAVREPASWSGQSPAGGHPPVSLGAVEVPTGLLLHPLGELTLSQRVLPLKVEINQYGSLSLPAPEYLALGVSVPGLALTASAVRDDFAPSQFFRMSDAEKLSRPSFESLESGVRLASAESVSTPPYEHCLDAGSAFETVIIDPNLPQPREAVKVAVKASVQSGLAEHGAAAQAPLSEAGSAKYKGGGARVTTAETNYLVATAQDLKPTQIGGIDPRQGVPYSQADDALRLYLSEHPSEGGLYTLAGVHEVSA
jgi:hypothetical protein